MTFNRRDFLRAGLAGLPFCTLGRSLRAMAGADITTPPNPDRRMLTIFLRGANDALNTIIPHGDPTYEDPAITMVHNRPSTLMPSSAVVTVIRVRTGPAPGSTSR